VSRRYIGDFYSKAGGMGCGLRKAGWYVIGIDKDPQPRYAGDEFIQGDALKLLADKRFLAQFDAIHASPPCQKDSQATLSQRRAGREYPKLIGPTRKLLQASGLPWMMENVPRAPLRPDYVLCGCMFGLGRRDLNLQLRRERKFETSWGPRPLALPPHQHWGYSISICGHGTPTWMRKRTGHVGVAIWREVMGVDWMTREELAEALPVSYGEFMGREMLAQLREAAA
jgi:DNA (cytosine-5)-methyltransferase 1